VHANRHSLALHPEKVVRGFWVGQLDHSHAIFSRPRQTTEFQQTLQVRYLHLTCQRQKSNTNFENNQVTHKQTHKRENTQTYTTAAVFFGGILVDANNA
jgi:hypothetical protein